MKTLILISFTVFNIISFVFVPIQTANATTSYCIPIIMYHCVLKEPNNFGKYIISPNGIEQDILYLKKHGYTSIKTEDLIDYKEKNKPLPKKPVLLTFDDGCLNNLVYCIPILEKYEFNAVFSLVGEFCDNYSKNPDRNLNYSVMTWNDVKLASENPYIEIANHTFSMHKYRPRFGCSKLKYEDTITYQKNLTKDLFKMQEKIKEITGSYSTTFTYPYGDISPDSYPILENLGFKISLTCTEGLNYINKKSSLYNLKRYNRSGLITTAQFMEKAKIL